MKMNLFIFRDPSVNLTARLLKRIMLFIHPADIVAERLIWPVPSHKSGISPPLLNGWCLIDIDTCLKPVP